MLLDFSGREDRSSFWPYAAIVLVVSTLLSVLAVIPSIFSVMRSVREYARAHPEKVTVIDKPGHYSMSIDGGEFVPDFGLLFWAIGLVFLVTVFLYAAAVARRLHDTGRSGWWGVMPLPFAAFSLLVMARLFAPGGPGMEQRLGLFFAVFLGNLLYMAALAILIVLLAMKSEEGPNRFGG